VTKRTLSLVVVGAISALLAAAASGAVSSRAEASSPAGGATAPHSTAGLPPFWKWLRGVRQAWKESPEARSVVTVFRKTTQRAVVKWRSSKGVFCPWRLRKPTFCNNGWAYAADDIEIFVKTQWGRRTLGYVDQGSVLSVACWRLSNALDLQIRVLWPAPTVPWAFVDRTLLDPYMPPRLTDLPIC
jgi:hypothetical protein